MAFTDAARTRSIGVPGVALNLAGVALLLVAFTSVDWYPGSNRPSAVVHIRFNDLHNLTASTSVGLAKAYFAWLSWVLLLVVIAVGFVANLPSPVANGLRIAGLAVGLAGAAVTYLALNKLASWTGSHSAFDHARAGVWLALAGYLVAGAGAALGPRRHD
jgi:hypothetical protein